MRYCKQKHLNGCAIASIAMLSKTGYDKVMRIVHPAYKSYKRPYPGICLEDILKSMEKLNLNTKISFVKQDVTKLKVNALITIAIGNKRHAVIWDATNKQIFDPWHKVSSVNINKQFIKKNMVFIIT